MIRRWFQRTAIAEVRPEHGCSENVDFFGGYMCFCDEASWNEYHAAEVAE